MQVSPRPIDLTIRHGAIQADGEMFFRFWTEFLNDVDTGSHADGKVSISCWAPVVDLKIGLEFDQPVLILKDQEKHRSGLKWVPHLPFGREEEHGSPDIAVRRTLSVLDFDVSGIRTWIHH